jgi:hypothetical protein
MVWLVGSKSSWGSGFAALKSMLVTLSRLSALCVWSPPRAAPCQRLAALSGWAGWHVLPWPWSATVARCPMLPRAGSRCRCRRLARMPGSAWHHVRVVASQPVCPCTSPPLPLCSSGHTLPLCACRPAAVSEVTRPLTSLFLPCRHGRQPALVGCSLVEPSRPNVLCTLLCWPVPQSPVPTQSRVACRRAPILEFARHQAF